jgi:hypothetical protein
MEAFGTKKLYPRPFFIGIVRVMVGVPGSLARFSGVNPQKDRQEDYAE